MAANVQRSTHSNGASVSISSFPFLYDIAAHGDIQGLEVTDRGVPVGPFRLDEVRFDASRIHFDRRELLYHRSVHITMVRQASVAVVFRLSNLESSLANQFGVQVTATGSDRVLVTAEGRTLATIDLTKIPIVPLCPVQVTHTGETYTFSCTVSEVPQPVLDALSKAVNKAVNKA